MIAIILPTDYCNLRCNYCSARKGNNTMSDDTLVNALAFTDWVTKETSDIHHKNHIEWHAGEPLSLPVSFYERAEEILGDLGYDHQRIFCTNLTLWDDKWADFCDANDYHISTSLDGPQYIHDANRGAGTWEKVIANIIKLKESGSKFGCIAVMSKIACENPIDMYEFFRDAKIDVQLNPCIPVTDQRLLIDAHKTMFDAWFDDHSIASIHPFDDMVKFTLKHRYRVKCHDMGSHGIVCVDVHGGVHNCERFVSDYPTGSFAEFGNVNTDDFEDIWYGANRTHFLEYLELLPTACYSCPYLDWCGGGCVFDGFIQGCTEKRCGTDCKLVTELLDHVEERAGWMRCFG